MIQFKQIWKTIVKNRTSSILTLISLVISFVGIIILTLYVSFEKSFDRFHKNAASIYRLETKQYGSDVPAPTSDLIKENIPEVEKICLLYFHDGKITTPKQELSNLSFRTDMLFVSDSFFDIFSFKLLSGDPKAALTNPFSVVLTETYATKLFDRLNPVGESVLLDDKLYNITGVMQDFPENSSFRADYLVSFSTCEKEDWYGVKNWSMWNFNIFMKLNDNANPKTVANKIEQIALTEENFSDIKTKNPEEPAVRLSSLKDIHYIQDDKAAYVNPVVIDILILLAIILAIMGAVNFVNFVTSQAPLRARTLSVLQILGGKRISSMAQLISESVILSICALTISFLIYQISYSKIETILDIAGLSIVGRYRFVLWFILFAIGFGVLAGLYPARYITSSPLTQSIKGNNHFSGKGKSFRNALVTIQFIFTITLLVSTFVIKKQLIFWQNYNLGINKEHVVYINTTNVLREHSQAFADELMTNSDIIDYTYSQFIPGDVGMGWGRNVDGQSIHLKCWPVDDKFMDFFGIKITEGRGFTKNSQADINTYILNIKATEEFGWDDPLEHQIEGFGFMGQVIGVADNINYASLKEEIGPMLFWRTETRKNNLILRLKPGNTGQTVAFIQNIAGKFDPKNHSEVKFLDNSLDKLYGKEEKMGNLIELGAIWCISLAITGLLGLIIFICRDRIKEIGIRRVNGAKVSEVVVVLNKDLLKWVAIAFVVATPVAYYAMHKWLENFAYKTSLSWWIFVLAGLLALGIALLTVSWQSWRAATRNPVEALRYE